MSAVASPAPSPAARPVISHRIAFWFGSVAVVTGVALHLPMFFGAADMHYRLVGMSPDPPMLLGMALIVLGLVVVTYSLVPAWSRLARVKSSPDRLFSVRVLDDAPLTRNHLILLLVMAVAITIDAMKPITLGFVTPGMAKEYGLKSPLTPHGHVPVALLPVFGLGGTVLGSLAWGWLGDRIGRRASILLAGVFFIATSICGAMPSYQWNFVMCFIMGLAAGGMLPITLTLIAELMPKRHRGWAIVLIGGEIALAYVAVSSLASALIPHYSWRIMWLAGLPTGALLIALQRHIPESPRFLASQGRSAEATAILRRYGGSPDDPSAAEKAHAQSAPLIPVRAAWQRVTRTATIVILAGGVGLATYGMQLWIPTNLQKLGFTADTSATFLRDSALLGLPVTVAFAYLYTRWSTVKSILLLTAITVAALIVFAASGAAIVRHPTELRILLIIPTATVSSVLAAVLAYATESHPTKVRSRASGVAAGASKAGGVAITILVAAAAAPPSLRATALLAALPLLVGAAALAVVGHDTHGLSLEDANPALAEAIA
jgi:putative MFS transporter